MKRTAPGRAWVKTQSWNSWHLPGTFPWCHLQGSWKVTQSLHSFPVQASVTSIRIISTSSWAALFFKLLLALHFPNIAPFKVIFFWMSCSDSFISLFFFARLSQPPLFDSFFLFHFIFLTTFCWCPFPSRHASPSSAFFLLIQWSLNFFHKGLDSKYFRLCGSHVFCHSCLPLLLTGQKQPVVENM